MLPLDRIAPYLLHKHARPLAGAPAAPALAGARLSS